METALNKGNVLLQRLSEADAQRFIDCMLRVKGRSPEIKHHLNLHNILSRFVMRYIVSE